MEALQRGLITTAVTELIKLASPKITGFWAALVAVVTGIIVQFVAEIASGATYTSAQPVANDFLIGLVLGATVAGLYAIGMKAAKKAGASITLQDNSTAQIQTESVQTEVEA